MYFICTLIVSWLRRGQTKANISNLGNSNLNKKKESRRKEGLTVSLRHPWKRSINFSIFTISLCKYHPIALPDMGTYALSAAVMWRFPSMTSVTTEWVDGEPHPGGVQPRSTNTERSSVGKARRGDLFWDGADGHVCHRPRGWLIPSAWLLALHRYYQRSASRSIAQLRTLKAAHTAEITKAIFRLAEKRKGGGKRCCVISFLLFLSSETKLKTFAKPASLSIFF